MNICILENDARDPRMAPHIERLGDLFVRLFRAAGAHDWRFDVFHAQGGEYPASFAGYDAVILTGSRADAFSSEPWIVELRARVARLLAERKKLLGICFGHQVLGFCLGAPVARAPQGWNMGRIRYDWHDPQFPVPHGTTSFELHTTHQDQVLALPPGARLLASTPNCPVAGFAVEDRVFSLQPHPEMDAIILGNLIHARREKLGEQKFADGIASLREDHDGVAMARLMMAFVACGRDGE
jgi:GMP synthase-like glutamine amidotransferase